ncbi:MAG: hypothetical protein IPN03_20575 [Holophagales bacterium]|nr:hypothetical protein [Holophagales bacterium]MBK9376045.1 hypothetical protein [Holophagales bacterium]
MKRRLALFLLLAGTFVAARIIVAHAVNGRRPEVRQLALHAVAVPLVQLALLEAAERLRARSRGAA